ncbi:IS66 family insertion sequence element accessory protein TnpB, partial [Escherichia coli]|nr:IS66 family insertion sequence element accessory protein TnpB [Escherichia coli]EIO2910887.1 IS66 family insertion sequence element accessory protein TnpB [Escherichia coli]EKB6806842.1 IS66 family insertion sequence element accessory protein TnpB [Escherichia coli]EKG5159730.1 IS66 family insertion sequence element accessory protein TnpB [Escherichia coli]ELR3607415.1 IS66 family insertion sequence element accessory protein TnpB [Escherichia coli]
SAPDASSVIHATGGDRVATSQTDRTAWHPDITRDKTGE